MAEVPCYRLVRAGPNPLANDLTELWKQPAGRWSFRGRPILYFSSSISLALLEHQSLSGTFGLPFIRNVIEFRAPRQLIRPFKSFQLPKGWDMRPALDVTRAFTDQNLLKADLLGVEVPSTIVPFESTFLIATGHPSFLTYAEKIRTVGPLKF